MCPIHTYGSQLNFKCHHKDSKQYERKIPAKFTYSLMLFLFLHLINYAEDRFLKRTVIGKDSLAYTEVHFQHHASKLPGLQQTSVNTVLSLRQNSIHTWTDLQRRTIAEAIKQGSSVDFLNLKKKQIIFSFICFIGLVLSLKKLC